MAEIQWIKLAVDMFDNRKIRHLRHLPEGNNIILIWVMLLTMAGRCNAGGMIFLTENIPYTPKMLADELDFEESTVRMALEALARLNMVSMDGNLAIVGWEEHQNIDGMERIREQNRIRKQKQRALAASSRDCHGTVTQEVTPCHATDKEEEIEEDKEKEITYTPTPYNDTEKRSGKRNEAGAGNEGFGEGVYGDGTDIAGACGNRKAESGRTGSADRERTEAGANRVRGRTEKGPLDWHDLSKDRLH